MIGMVSTSPASVRLGGQDRYGTSTEALDCPAAALLVPMSDACARRDRYSTAVATTALITCSLTPDVVHFSIAITNHIREASAALSLMTLW